MTYPKWEVIDSLWPGTEGSLKSSLPYTTFYHSVCHSYSNECRARNMPYIDACGCDFQKAEWDTRTRILVQPVLAFAHLRTVKMLALCSSPQFPHWQINRTNWIITKTSWNYTTHPMIIVLCSAQFKDSLTSTQLSSFLNTFLRRMLVVNQPCARQSTFPLVKRAHQL